MDSKIVLNLRLNSICGIYDKEIVKNSKNKPFLELINNIKKPYIKQTNAFQLEQTKSITIDTIQRILSIKLYELRQNTEICHFCFNKGIKIRDTNENWDVNELNKEKHNKYSIRSYFKYLQSSDNELKIDLDNYEESESSSSESDSKSLSAYVSSNDIEQNNKQQSDSNRKKSNSFIIVNNEQKESSSSSSDSNSKTLSAYVSSNDIQQINEQKEDELLINTIKKTKNPNNLISIINNINLGNKQQFNNSNNDKPQFYSSPINTKHEHRISGLTPSQYINKKVIDSEGNIKYIKKKVQRPYSQKLSKTHPQKGYGSSNDYLFDDDSDDEKDYDVYDYNTSIKKKLIWCPTCEKLYYAEDSYLKINNKNDNYPFPQLFYLSIDTKNNINKIIPLTIRNKHMNKDTSPFFDLITDNNKCIKNNPFITAYKRSFKDAATHITDTSHSMIRDYVVPSVDILNIDVFYFPEVLLYHHYSPKNWHDLHSQLYWPFIDYYNFGLKFFKRDMHENYNITTNTRANRDWNKYSPSVVLKGWFNLYRDYILPFSWFFDNIKKENVDYLFKNPNSIHTDNVFFQTTDESIYDKDDLIVSFESVFQSFDVDETVVCINGFIPEKGITLNKVYKPFYNSLQEKTFFDIKNKETLNFYINASEDLGVQDENSLFFYKIILYKNMNLECSIAPPKDKKLFIKSKKGVKDKMNIVLKRLQKIKKHILINYSYIFKEIKEIKVKTMNISFNIKSDLSISTLTSTIFNIKPLLYLYFIPMEYDNNGFRYIKINNLDNSFLIYSHLKTVKEYYKKTETYEVDQSLNIMNKYFLTKEQAEYNTLKVNGTALNYIHYYGLFTTIVVSKEENFDYKIGINGLREYTQIEELKLFFGRLIHVIEKLQFPTKVDKYTNKAIQLIDSWNNKHKKHIQISNILDTTINEIKVLTNLLNGVREQINNMKKDKNKNNAFFAKLQKLKNNKEEIRNNIQILEKTINTVSSKNRMYELFRKLTNKKNADINLSNCRNEYRPRGTGLGYAPEIIPFIEENERLLLYENNEERLNEEKINIEKYLTRNNYKEPEYRNPDYFANFDKKRAGKIKFKTFEQLENKTKRQIHKDRIIHLKEDFEQHDNKNFFLKDCNAKDKSKSFSKKVMQQLASNKFNFHPGKTSKDKICAVITKKILQSSQFISMKDKIKILLKYLTTETDKGRINEIKIRSDFYNKQLQNYNNIIKWSENDIKNFISGKKTSLMFLKGLKYLKVLDPTNTIAARNLQIWFVYDILSQFTNKINDNILKFLYKTFFEKNPNNKKDLELVFDYLDDIYFKYLNIFDEFIVPHVLTQKANVLVNRDYKGNIHETVINFNNYALKCPSWESIDKPKFKNHSLVNFANLNNVNNIENLSENEFRLSVCKPCCRARASGKSGLNKKDTKKDKGQEAITNINTIKFCTGMMTWEEFQSSVVVKQGFISTKTNIVLQKGYFSKIGVVYLHELFNNWTKVYNNKWKNHFFDNFVYNIHKLTSPGFILIGHNNKKNYILDMLASALEIDIKTVIKCLHGKLVKEGEKFFNCLNQGEFALRFNTTNSFKNYLMKEEVEMKWIVDLINYPGCFQKHKDGINLIMFETNSLYNNVSITEYNNIFFSEYVKPNRSTMFFLKNNDLKLINNIVLKNKKFIHYIFNNDFDIKIKNKDIKKQINAVTKDLINSLIATSLAIKKDKIPICDCIINKLNKDDNNLVFKSQIIDIFNKTIAIETYHKNDPNFTFLIPVLPSKYNPYLKFKKYNENESYCHSVEDNKEILDNYITPVLNDYSFFSYILSDIKDKIVGIELHNNLLIPVKPVTITNNWKIKYKNVINYAGSMFFNINRIIKQGKEYVPKQEMKRRFNYEIYQRLLIEISEYINLDNKMKEILKSMFDKLNKTINMELKYKIKNFFIRLVEQLIRKTCVIKKVKELEKTNYKTENIYLSNKRTLCKNNKKSNFCDNNKLILPEDKINLFIGFIVEAMIQNTDLQYRILNNNINKYIDKFLFINSDEKDHIFISTKD